MSSIFGICTRANNGDILDGQWEDTGAQLQAQKCSNCATLEFCENAKFGESRPDSAQSAEIPQNPAKCKSAGQFCINPTLHPISSILRHSFRQGAGGSLAITRPEKSSRKKRDPDRSPSTGQLFSRTVPAFSLFGLVSLKIWGHFPEFSISSRRKWFHSRWDGMWLVLDRAGNVKRGSERSNCLFCNGEFTFLKLEQLCHQSWRLY